MSLTTSPIEKWKERLRAGAKYKKEYGNITDDGGIGCWERNTAYYRHKFDASLPYNLIFGMARAIIPTLYFRNPYVTVTPMSDPRLVWHAHMLEAIDNYLIGTMGAKKVVKKMILDTYLKGSGFLKTGYDSEFGFFPLDEQAGVEDDLVDTTLTQTSRKGDRVEYNTSITPGMPWIARVAPENIIVPVGTTCLEDCEWIAHVVLRAVDDLKADVKYKNTGDLKGTHIELLKGSGVNRDVFKDEEGRELIEIIEIRDFKTGEIKVLSLNSDKWLRAPEEDLLQIGGMPFCHLQWNDDTDFIWGSAADATLISAQQKEMNESRDLLQAHRRISRARIMVDMGVVSEEEAKKITDGEAGAVIRAKSMNPGSVHEFNTTMPGDVAAWLNLIREDVRELLGFSRVQMGEFETTGRRTATEAQLVQQAHTIRMDEKRDAVADLIVQMIKKVNQTIFSFWSKDRVTQLVGQDGVVNWVEYTPSAIKGDYNVKVDVESMVPQTKGLRKQEIIEVMQLMVKMPGIDINYLLKILAKEYDWLDTMQMLPQNSQPMGMNQFVQQQQQMPQAQIQDGRQQVFGQLQQRIGAQ
jgi:hypothetical protein